MAPPEPSGGRRTPLYERHVALGARMIDFHGWTMPVEYRGILQEHRAVREQAGIFDLSHMGELVVSGQGAPSFLDWVLTRRVSDLPDGRAVYSLLCRHDGGIVDDIIVYRRSDHYLLVVNAANRDKDLNWLHRLLDEWTGVPSRSVSIRDESDRIALLAVQGPAAEALLKPLVEADLSSLPSFAAVETRVDGYAVFLSRTGYTGEDGFEMYVDGDDAVPLWDRLLEAGTSKGLVPVGLGARDTLRLEARFVLYGNDIDESTNPLEAGLQWAVDFDKPDFVGRAALQQALAQGVQRRLVGFEMIDRGIPRKGYAIFPREATETDGQRRGGIGASPPAIGIVTSGNHSPTLGRPIGLGYVAIAYAPPGETLAIDVRGQLRRARVVKGRFAPVRARS